MEGASPTQSPKQSPTSSGMEGACARLEDEGMLKSPKEEPEKKKRVDFLGWVKQHITTPLTTMNIGRHPVQVVQGKKKVAYQVSSTSGGGRKVADNLFKEAFNETIRGNLKEAKEKYRKLLKVHHDFPRIASAAFNLALIVQDEDDGMAEAMDLYRLAVKNDPAHVNAHFNLGVMSQWDRNYKDAIAEFREVLKLDPDHETAQKALEALLRPTMNRGFVAKKKMSLDSWLPGKGKKTSPQRHSEGCSDQAACEANVTCSGTG